jgi:hypothetical protein
VASILEFSSAKFARARFGPAANLDRLVVGSLLLKSPPKHRFAAVADVGIAIRLIGETQSHIGMLYRIPPDEPLNLNLRDHFDLRNEPPTDNYCWAQIDLDEINRRLLASLCFLIGKKCSEIPYGFTYNGLYFAPTGEYLSHDLGHGLTCATFVMAIFETQSLRILKTDEWLPADFDDQLWQTTMASGIGQRRGEILGSTIAKFVGQPRYKPEHVAAGAIDEKRPLGRDAAIKVGQRIMKELERARRS